MSDCGHRMRQAVRITDQQIDAKSDAKCE